MKVCDNAYFHMLFISRSLHVMLSSSVFSKTENITANSPLHINQMHVLIWTEISALHKNINFTFSCSYFYCGIKWAWRLCSCKYTGSFRFLFGMKGSLAWVNYLAFLEMKREKPFLNPILNGELHLYIYTAMREYIKSSKELSNKIPWLHVFSACGFN